jgi:hypothetical protein
VQGHQHTLLATSDSAALPSPAAANKIASKPPEATKADTSSAVSCPASRPPTTMPTVAEETFPPVA